VLMIGGALLTVMTNSRLTAVCALGVVGYAAAMLFIMFRAPDLAMTQLAIETLTVILFVLVIYRLPRFAVLSSKRARVRDATIAILGGAVMTTVVLAATFTHAPSGVSEFYAKNSLATAQGRNMVNVILVDFRGLDTLGEITVLAVAALGVFALMRLRQDSEQAGADGDDPEETAAPASPTEDAISAAENDRTTSKPKAQSPQ